RGRECGCLMDSPLPWHQLFGLSWQDFFQDGPIEVELEHDLSHHKQFLDVIIHCPQPGPPTRRPPDGFETLARYNLLTFKSHQEALDLEAVEELFGHYINYRKQTSAEAKLDGLLSREDFRLFAVCIRRPLHLLKSKILKAVAPGVYDSMYYSNPVRVVVVRELPLVEHNAVLHLFSVDPKQAMYGAANYRPIRA
ncbi:MAG: hypothetical protein ACRDD1_15840, partial [Planctomycetia bacterium]